jgi:AraC-like DNA-binding protein
MVWPDYSVSGSLHSFSDQLSGGTSLIQARSGADTVFYRYRLGDRPEYPFAGINIRFPQDSITLEDYENLEVELMPAKAKRIPVYLSFIGKKSNEKDFNSFIPKVYDLNLDAKRKRYSIPLAEMQVPAWWTLAFKHYLAEDEPAKLRYVRHIGFSSCQLLPRQVWDEIQIYSITLRRSRFWFYLIWSACLVLSVCFLVYQRWYFKPPVRIQYTPEEIINRSDEETSKIFEYLTQHYIEQELSIEDIQRATGISVSRIGLYIKKVSGESFKQTLNRLRVTEAKRMMLESDRMISEIAYGVGYSNASHFNRIFKSMEGCTPKEFREKHKKD